MISKEYKKYTLICDICNGGTDEEFDTFQDAVDGRKEIGWKVRKIDGEWQDVCPECQEVSR